jgi:membrane protease subunit HflK
MEKNAQKNGLINLLVMVAVAIAAFAVTRLTNSAAGMVALIFLAVAVLVNVVSWFQMGLEQRERLERLELEELAKGHARTAMFEGGDSEVFPAQRSREQFERFFVPIFTVVLCIIQAGSAYFLWRWLTKAVGTPLLKEPTVGLSLFALFSLVLFLLGKFSTTMARLQNLRLLRPGASYMLLGAYLCATVTVGIICVWAGSPKADFYVAHGLCVLLALVAAETLVNLVLEIYRPRVKGKVERPLYESRLVGILGQPEGLITTAAQALDYQFGFKVSETWFYRLFVERALVGLIVLQAAALFLSTGVVFIEPGEQGLLERFGKPVEGRTLLNPGPHIVWPRPIDKVYRFRTDQIQSFEIGAAPNTTQDEGKVILWTVAHAKGDKEDNFLVAARGNELQESITNSAGETRRPPPVSLLTGTIPVQFQITNLIAWEYNNEDAPSLMHDLAAREVVRMLAGVDMIEVMSSKRLETAQALHERIQQAVSSRGLGASIVSVGLQDLHPPVKVAPDFEKVIAATNTARAKVLAARADAVRTNALAGAQATTIVNTELASATRTKAGALANASLFTNQITAYEASPSFYLERTYLDTFVRSTANARKYVMLTTNAQRDVHIFDLQEKIRPDILTDVAAPPVKK